MKIQRGFKLSDHTMDMLREFAQAKNINNTEALETLIIQAHTKLQMEKKGEGK